MLHTDESSALPSRPFDITGRFRSTLNAMLAPLGVAMACLAGNHIAAAGQEISPAARTADSAPGRDAPYGWYPTNAGDPKYEKYGPRELTNQRQLNQPIGEVAAERIARGLGLDKSKVFTKEQFIRFVTGTGNEPMPPSPFDKLCPQLADKSIRILTNTIGNPLIYKDSDGNEIATVLASYGLMVNEAGMLQSPANTAAPTRQVNVCLIPGGYLDRWAQANDATASIEMLKNSAYTLELPYGNQSQQQATAAQLVGNQKPARSAVVGMSMPPALWNINFSLIYTLNPKLAANMPARWAPIPQRVVDALEAATDPTTGEPTGQVPFEAYRSYFEGSWYPLR